MKTRRLAVLVAAAVVGASAVPVGAVASAVDAVELSSTPVSATAAWKADVLDDPDGLVYPAAVQIQGDASAVDAPYGLAAEGGQSTTIRSSGLSSAPTPTLVIDLGLNTGGFVEVGVTASDGTPFRLGYSETRQFLRAIGDITPRPAGATSSFGRDDDPDHRNDVFAPRVGSNLQTFRSPAVRGGQRWLWLQVEGAGTVSIDYVRVAVTHHRVTADDYAGWFHSSDAGLNRAWFSSAYTTNLTTIRDARVEGSPFVYVDGAKRDRLIWNGDAMLAALAGLYSTARGPEFARNTLNALACQQEPSGYIPMASQIVITCPVGDPGPADGRPPGAPPHDTLNLGDTLTLPAYAAAWVSALHQYWRYTGDVEFVRPLLPVARRGLRYFADRLVAGLFPANTNRVELTWHIEPSPGGFDGYTNMAYFRALGDLARLERHVAGDATAAARYERHAGQLRRNILRSFWDPIARAFVVNPADPQVNHTSDVNVEAVGAGLVDGRRAEQALRYVSQHLATQFGTLNGERPADPYMLQVHSTYMMTIEVWTRFEHGDTAGALDLLRRGYVRMAQLDPGTMWERIGPDGTPWMLGPPTNNVGSLAHGSASITPSLSAWVLGIRPARAGFETWTVAPQPGDLAFAQGRVPTPRGSIDSRWERGSGGSFFRMTVAAPPDTTGTVKVPLLGGRRVIAADGVVVWDGDSPAGGHVATSDGEYVHIEGVRPGLHTFAWAS